MKSHSPVIAATVLVSTIFGVGIAASGSAGAQPPTAGKVTTSTRPPNTLPVCYSGANCRPVKNAALPTTTTTKAATKAVKPKKSTKARPK